MVIALFKTFLIATLPVLEIRGALPIAYYVYHLPFWLAFLFSFLGNILPIIFILIFLEKLFFYFEKHLKPTSPLRRLVNWYFNYSEQKVNPAIKKWGKVGLTIFTAIPLPLTGAWTASIFAFLMKLNKKESFFLISLGVFIAGIIIGLLMFLGKITIN